TGQHEDRHGRRQRRGQPGHLRQEPARHRGAEGQYIANLRDKLETKAFDNAKLYYTLGGYDVAYYKSAVVALKNTQIEFPDIKYIEEIDLLIVKSQYMYAKNSYPHRQEERFKEAIGYYNEFMEAHPTSKLVAEAKQLKEDSEAGIASAKKILAKEAEEAAKYATWVKKDEKQKDTTTKKVEIKTPIK
ncbi:MAG TPA: hypothetical protein VL088_10980, partial [Pedobacter sp.]|nr:hypothetical protein [Pedobacter sp.]